MLWELVRIHRLDSSQGITPQASRRLIGNNATVGPNVKTILLGDELGRNSVLDLGKAERDAQVRELGLHPTFSVLIDASLHGNTLILRSYRVVALL